VFLWKKKLALQTLGAVAVGLGAVPRRGGGSQTESSRLSGSQNRYNFSLAGLHLVDVG
jgi:hypothetical protein